MSRALVRPCAGHLTPSRPSRMREPSNRASMRCAAEYYGRQDLNSSAGPDKDHPLRREVVGESPPCGEGDVTLSSSDVCLTTTDVTACIEEHTGGESAAFGGRQGGDGKRAREGHSPGQQRLKRAKASDVVGSQTTFCPVEVEQIGKNLLTWYDEVHRELPWRKNPGTSTKKCDPGACASPDLPPSVFAYRVWVSEVMLQQTQVATVIEYFNKWIKIWPDVESLEKATLDEVHEVWSGLGYYRRAGYLLSGAKYVIAELDGKFPTTATELLKVPGVGPYTSAAVASIAFGEAVAAVDGNVTRVVSRLRALDGNPKKLTKTHQKLASEMLDTARPGDFNQAVMELGATICRPSNPMCGECPLQGMCLARKKVIDYQLAGGCLTSAEAPDVTDYPTSIKKKAKKEQSVAICVLKVVSEAGEENEVNKNSSGFFLMAKRPNKGLLAGLWEFPTVSEIGKLSDKERKSAVLDMLKDRFRISLKPKGDFEVVDRMDVGEGVHIFSHVRMTMKVERLILKGNKEDVWVGKGDDVKWVASEDMPKQSLSTMVKKSWQIFHGYSKSPKNSIRKYLAVEKE